MSTQKIGFVITHSLQKIFPGSTDIPDRREGFLALRPKPSPFSLPSSTRGFRSRTAA